MTTRTKEEIAARLEFFVAALQDHCQKLNNVTFYKPVIGIMAGKKNWRITRADLITEGACAGMTQSKCVHCFVDMETGDIYKAAGWKAPAKGVRGNIFDDNFSINKGVTEYGASYLR
jgi:hypothetical protein